MRGRIPTTSEEVSTSGMEFTTGQMSAFPYLVIDILSEGSIFLVRFLILPSSPRTYRIQGFVTSTTRLIYG